MLATNPVSSNTLSRRAMIVSLSISQWSGRRLDRRVTDEVNTQHNAASDAGRYNKQLLDKSALADIQKLVGQARTEFAERTLPWIDDGSRIMANQAHTAFTRWFRGIQTSFDTKVAEFLSAYPAHVADARKRLNGMFEDGDYPDVSELRGKFSIDVRVMPVPTADDFRVAMSEAQADEIRAEIERNVEEAMASAVRDIYRRVHSVASRMVERLNGYRPATEPGEKAEGVFRDSLVANVRDLIDVLPTLNITGDPALADMARKLEPLAVHDASRLRDDPKARKDAAAAAQKILDDIGGFLA